MANGDGRIIDPTRMPPPGAKMMAINVQLKQEVVVAAAKAVMQEMGLTPERLAALDHLAQELGVVTIRVSEIEKAVNRIVAGLHAEKP